MFRRIARFLRRPGDSGHRWPDDDYHGASLAAWLEPMRERGYRLVCCTLAGSNAVSVREDLAQAFGDYPPELRRQRPVRPFPLHIRMMSNRSWV